MTFHTSQNPQPQNLTGKQLAQKLPNQGHPVVFLDYDGTLTPIVNNPAKAFLTEDMRANVKAVAHELPVVIISGRERQDVQKLVGLEDVIYAGSHGYDIAGPDGLCLELEEAQALIPELKAVYHTLLSQLENFSGIYLELKRYTLAIHYRQASEGTKEWLWEKVHLILAEFPALKLKEGKQVYEIQPSLNWDKGQAMLWLMDYLGEASIRNYPIFLGDDLTDENAFALIKAPGMGVMVGTLDRPTAAKYHLEDVEEVQSFLKELHKRFKR